MAALRILLSGASGRMGRQIEALIDEDADLELVERADNTQFFSGQVPADVLIDFSRPELCQRSLDFALEQQIPMVIGTTGLNDSLQARIQQASTQIPILQAANFSVGIEVLRTLIQQAAAQLGADFDIEISETHHRDKLDAPSGTALLLADAVRSSDSDQLVQGRSGSDSKRQPQDITLHALRGGDVIGDHTVHFLGLGERIELSHRATDRSLFARGALRAAMFLVAQPPNLYGVEDLLVK